MNKNRKEKNATGTKSTLSPEVKKPLVIELAKASPIKLPVIAQILMELRLPVS